MIIETKYNLGDKIYPIHKSSEQIWNPCTACSETGKITLNDGEKEMCPKCYGRKGKIEWKSTKWMLIDDYPKEVKKSYAENGDNFLIPPFKIGQIRTQQDKKKKEVEYMCEETGVGSGTIWNEKHLFLSREEAQVECDRRNQLGE